MTQVGVLVGIFIAFLLKTVPATAAVPTFSKDVAPIFFQNCVKCHREGEIASSVSFLTYESTRPWARSIKEKVLTREMPPWPVDPGASVKFSNDLRLTQHDIDTIVAWVDAGAPKGSDSDLPPPPKPQQGWSHPKGLDPDVVISMPGEFRVPAQGEVPYVRFLAKIPFLQDKWIVASQLIPGNRSVVHHMAVTELELAPGVRPADLDALATLSRQLGIPNTSAPSRPIVAGPDGFRVFDMLGVYTPGTTFEMYGPDAGKLIKGGQNLYLNFNIHYTTTGKPETDRSMIGLWLQSTPPKHQLFRVPAGIDTIIVNGRELLTDTPGEKAEGTGVAIPAIPPYAPNYEVIGITTYPRPITIYQLQPHGHFRAKDFKYTVVYPDGHEETLLSVPKYNFNWQWAYDLATPLKLPAGSKLVVTAHYDNSRNNQSNPGPEKEVRFRAENQSWDEMFTPFMQFSIDTEPSNVSGHPGLFDIAEVVGCMQVSSEGNWTLAKAGVPVLSATQSTSSTALKAADARPLGDSDYELIGARVFNPEAYKGQKVAVKGIPLNLNGLNRINVTSLQKLNGTCQ